MIDDNTTRDNAVLGTLHDVGYGVDEDSWRRECEDRGYLFDPDEFREIVDRLVDDELVRVGYEDPAWAEERYMEDPGAWGDEWPENPPIHEAAEM
jgi:hypothetical protein